MTRPIPDLPDWIHEGAKVAVYSTEHMTPRFRPGVVERITPAQIVVQVTRGGTAGVAELRFHRKTLRTVGHASNNWKTGITELRQPDDPDVINARAANVARALGRTFGPKLAEADTLDRALEVLGWVEAAVADARERIAKLTPQTDADMARAARAATDKEK
jgi:hypothetical protein